MYPISFAIPYLAIIAYAKSYALDKSSYAPVVTYLKKYCSEQRPPKMKQILSSIYYLV